MAWKAELFRCQGGLNREDPMYTLPPGAASVGKNYEALPGGGYRRVDGYERFDGRTAAPHLATYQWIAFGSGGPTIPVSGQTISGAGGAWTAIVAGSPLLLTGAWASGTATGTMGITLLAGAAPVLGDEMKIGGAHVGNLSLVTGYSLVNNASIADSERKNWLTGAQDYYRSLIQKVPGQGAILGVCYLGGAVYAFRRDAGAGTTVAMYKSTTGGWSAVTLNDYIRFTNGTGEVFEGDTITGATSGHTAVVRRVNIAAGNWSGPTYASGRFCITGATGAFTNGENLQVGGVTKCVANGGKGTSSLTYDATCRMEFRTHNFFGGSNTKRMYGVDGFNRAFEFDGTYFCFIETAMASDKPNHIETHRNNLFLSFPGGSLQNSGTGTPLIWSVRSGASEIGIGDEITNVFSNGANTLMVTGRNSAYLLYGTSDIDWNLKAVSDSAKGGTPFCASEVNAQTVFADATSINVMAADATAASYQVIPISRAIRKTMVSSVAQTAKFSLGIAAKDHFRIFFADKTMVSCTFSGSKPVGFMQSLFIHQFVCGWVDNDASNNEVVYAGTDDGYIMQLETGTSFDGSAIESVLQLPYNYHKTPDRDKRFYKVSLEMDCPAAIDIRLLTDFNYGSEGLSTTADTTATPPSGGYWDFASWDQFFWDSAVVSNPELNIDGVAKNIALTFYHSDKIDSSFTLQAVLLQYAIWGVKR